ncbi:MAG: GTP-binding protein [Bacteroidia bacterium]|nr:GTP-binding protein [Bacteroidia bacterium]
MELLRFFTAGNVDDGKSTLIGRLLYDSNATSTDIIETLTKQSKNNNSNTEIDLALLTDGLRAEREQGITIDVAYKYFTTQKRKFIIADTPGHIQYTRNMFTGASNADLAIILVDARNGVTDQTKRHSIISSILGIPHLMVCINKMDLVDFSEQRFNEIKQDYLTFAKRLNVEDVYFIPVSALKGDNVVSKSTNINWYSGPSLLQYLEEVTIDKVDPFNHSRFQVQYVIRPQTNDLHDYRGFAGQVKSGVLKKGQTIAVLPENVTTTIAKIESNLQEVEEAVKNQPVIIHLKDDIDVSRGNTFAAENTNIKIDNEFSATLCWMDNTAYQPGQKMLLQHGSHTTKAMVKEIQAMIDIHTFEEIESANNLKLNDIAKVLIKTANPIAFDSYQANRNTGSFILINENTNNTVAAGTID